MKAVDEYVRKDKEEYFTSSEENEDFLYNERYYLSIILAIGKYLNNHKNLPELGFIGPSELSGPSEEIANIAEDLFNQMKVHDEENICGVGDKVRVMETRPLSKDKRWRLVEIIEKAK